MKGRFFLIVCLIIALYLAFVFANYNQHYHFTLPTFNLKSVSALAASINQAQPQAAQASTGSYSVVGSPTISAVFIDKVLTSAGSPAVGTGQILYNLGLKYGIDPVFALAFFQHESGFGTAGMARATLSLGNLRCISAYACYKGYAAFSSWQAGYEAWYKLIRSLYVDQWGLKTVGQIVPIYAPASDHNNPTGYIQAVENAVSLWRSGQL